MKVSDDNDQEEKIETEVRWLEGLNRDLFQLVRKGVDRGCAMSVIEKEYPLLWPDVEGVMAAEIARLAKKHGIDCAWKDPTVRQIRKAVKDTLGVIGSKPQPIIPSSECVTDGVDERVKRLLATRRMLREDPGMGRDPRVIHEGRFTHWGVIR